MIKRTPYVAFLVGLFGLIPTARADGLSEQELLAAAGVGDITPRAMPVTASAVGDVNDDGLITIVDGLLIAQYSVALTPQATFLLERGDVNNDGHVDILDALIVAQYTTGIVHEFCDGRDNDGDGDFDEGCVNDYAFFVVSDVQLTDNASHLTKALTKMKQLNDATQTKAFAGFSLGDLTMNGTENTTSTQWDLHDRTLTVQDSTTPHLLFDITPATVQDPSQTIPYYAVLGNHDGPGSAFSGSDWAAKWTRHLGQVPGANGINYSVVYKNSAFAVLDSVNPADDAEIQARLDAIRPALESPARFKFMLFHKPIFPCNTNQGMSLGYGAGLRWFDYAAEQNVDLLLNGHSHVYTRSAPLQRNASAVSRQSAGVVQIEVGTASCTAAPARVVETGTKTVTGTGADNQSYTLSYNCDVGSNLDRAVSENYTFCHVQVHTCKAVVVCYGRRSTETDYAEIDRFSINKCASD